MRIRLLVAVAACLVSAAGSPASASVHRQAPQPVGVTGGWWRMVFSDEFRAGSVDLGRWWPNWRGGTETDTTPPVNSAEQACYDPRQVTESNGALHLTAVASSCTTNSVTRPYRSGMVETVDTGITYLHGYVEARIKLPARSGAVDNWPAWWTAGNCDPWPCGGEDDVMEGMGGVVQGNYHGPVSAQVQPVSNAPFTNGLWHTYGSQWDSSGAIRWFYDGTLIGQASGAVARPQALILDYAVGGCCSGAIVTTESMDVDYVRVWQR